LSGSLGFKPPALPEVMTLGSVIISLLTGWLDEFTKAFFERENSHLGEMGLLRQRIKGSLQKRKRIASHG